MAAGTALDSGAIQRYRASMGDLLLSIDTAGSRCAVAVYDMAAKAVLAHADPDIGRGHAEVLMGLLADTLAEADASYADIARIAVVVGPGSFTGLRVGVASAKGLSLALEIDCVGVSTLEALAEPHWGGERPILSVLDAKRGEVYAALFGKGGTVLREPRALSPSELVGFVEAAGQEPLAAVGTGASIAAGVLGDRVVLLPESFGDIASVARIGAGRFATGPVQPLYLRGADARPQGPTGVSHVTRQATLP